MRIYLDIWFKLFGLHWPFLYRIWIIDVHMIMSDHVITEEWRETPKALALEAKDLISLVSSQDNL